MRTTWFIKLWVRNFPPFLTSDLLYHINSVANTLFIQVHCPIVRPEIIVLSDYGHTTIDFGSASIGQELSRTVLVQNISNKPIQVSREK